MVDVTPDKVIWTTTNPEMLTGTGTSFSFELMGMKVMCTCVGHPVCGDISEIMFSPRFLMLGYIDAPACEWRLDGNKVIQTFKDREELERIGVKDNLKNAGLQRVWILQDGYVGPDGERLGKWPD